MARGSDQATTAATSAQNLSNATAGNASALYGTLAPQLEADVAHPSGYSQPDLAAMETANLQSSGGGQSAAIGQGNLLATRNRNAGSPAAAIAKAARTGGEIASEGALGIQMKNADLKQKQRDRALAGLGDLYNTNLGSSVNALGEVAGNVNANTGAENASWNWTRGLSSIADLMNAGTNAYRSRRSSGG